jgi:hypothetical protein
MADLPELSDSAKRKLVLRWRTLLKANKLTGDHLHWHERERDRLARVAAQSPTSGLSRHKQDADVVGVFSSVTVAQARFNDMLVEYWRLWYSSGDGYESFGGWLRLLKRQVSDDIALIWKGESKRLDRWYKRACGPAVEAALESLVEEGIGRARAEELKRLEARTKPPEDSGRPVNVVPKAKAGARKRLPATVTSQIAASRMEAYIESKVMRQTSFANQIGTTDRTLRGFRKTGKVRRDIFDAIATGMGTTPEELVKPE